MIFNESERKYTAGSCANKITVLSPREVEDPSVFKTSMRAITKALAVGKKENKSQMKEMMNNDPDFLSVDSRDATIINRVTRMGIKIQKDQEEINVYSST